MATRESLRQAARCEKLADHLRSLPQREYGHGCFVRQATDQYDGFCGTVACALGHAASVQAKKFPGLALNINTRGSWPTLNTGLYNGNVIGAADDYFGPGSYRTVFSDEDDIYGRDIDKVTVDMVVERLGEFATNLRR